MAKRKRKLVKNVFQIEAFSSIELSDNVDSADIKNVSSTVADISNIENEVYFCLTRLLG